MKNLIDKSRVAFYGHRGSFSEEAALKLCGAGVELVPRPTFDALFSSVDEGLADSILTPIENSLAGSVARPLDLLLESSLVIKGEVIIRVSLHLVGCPGASLEDINAIESHPMALAQCEDFFAAHPHIKRLAAEDTAGSVARVIQTGDETRAAIAGQRAAEIYGGVILRSYLEDDQENYTRFVLLAPESDLPENADKLSLAVKLPERPDASNRALETFIRRGINFIKIEPRPVKGKPWQYRFYLDLEASTEDAEVVEALSELREYSDEVRVLGCYRKNSDVQV